MNGPLYDRLMTVRAITLETPETKSFSLDVAGDGLQFQPGQFVTVTADIRGARVRRAYSIASSPLDPEIVLTVKRLENGVLSPHLVDNVRVGDVLHVRGPYGRFTLEAHESTVVFIAGGSGIVPFRSMWRYILQTSLPIGFSVLCTFRTAQHVIYAQELAELAAAGHRIVLTLTRTEGTSMGGETRRIDEKMVRDFVGTIGGQMFYVCGPPRLCQDVVQHLLQMGVERSRIKIEQYD